MKSTKNIRTRLQVCGVGVALAVVIAGCGGASESGTGVGDKTFSDHRFALTFSYPDILTPEEVSDVAFSNGEAEARAALALDTHNAVVLSKYTINLPVTSTNIAAVAPQFDEAVAEAVGRPVRGEITDVGGLPAVRYGAIPIEQPAQGESQLLFVFDQRDEYQLNCQSTPEERTRLNEACARVMATLRRA